MSYNMSNSRFPAVLKTLDDQIVADTGVIQISIEDKSVDFKSEFIPLYKLGDQLKIVRIQDGIEVVSYVGEVYLSSQHILRLVSVTETVLPAARSVFSYDVDLTGKLIARVLDTSHKRFLFFGKKPRYRETVFDAQIHSIALRGVKFTTPYILEDEQTISLNMLEPRLKDVLLDVKKAIDMGQEMRSYQCVIRDIDRESRDNLENFIASLNNQKGQAFR